MNTLTGKIHYPSYDGWHPAGCNPGQQFLPRVEVDGGLFHSYMDNNIVEFLVGEKLQKFQVIQGETIAKDDDDGSSTCECNLVPLE